MINCQSCGAALQDNEKFCARCGSQVTIAQEPPQSAWGSGPQPQQDNFNQQNQWGNQQQSPWGANQQQQGGFNQPNQWGNQQQQGNLPPYQPDSPPPSSGKAKINQSSIVLGIVGIVLGIISFFVFGWLSIACLTSGIGAISANIREKKTDKSKDIVVMDKSKRHQKFVQYLQDRT